MTDIIHAPHSLDDPKPRPHGYERAMSPDEIEMWAEISRMFNHYGAQA